MKEILKAVVRAVALLAVLPPLASFHVRALIFGRNRAIEGSSQVLALFPGLIGQYLRRAFLQRALAGCGRDAVIEFGVLFSDVRTRIGDRAYIGPRCHIGLADIGEDVLLAPAVQVPSGSRAHGTADPTQPIRDQPGARTMVKIGAGAWIGASSVVMADVGAHTVVGAGAVVVKALPDLVVAGGVPARVLRVRTAPPAQMRSA